jgi:hypothetical protein
MTGEEKNAACMKKASSVRQADVPIIEKNFVPSIRDYQSLLYVKCLVEAIRQVTVEETVEGKWMLEISHLTKEERQIKRKVQMMPDGAVQCLSQALGLSGQFQCPL